MTKRQPSLQNADDRPNAEQFLAALITLKERWEANKEEWERAIEKA